MDTRSTILSRRGPKGHKKHNNPSGFPSLIEGKVCCIYAYLKNIQWHHVQSAHFGLPFTFEAPPPIRLRRIRRILLGNSNKLRFLILAPLTEGKDQSDSALCPILVMSPSYVLLVPLLRGVPPQDCTYYS